MSDRINLESRAVDMIGEIIAYDMKTLDLDALRDGISDAAHQEADNACIYTHHCLQILDDYERHSAAPNESEMGGEFRSDQWREAATAWAYEVACSVLCAEASEAIDTIEERADELCDALIAILPGGFTDASDLTVTRDCPHGWAAHDKEAGAVLYWISKQLDGLNALAIDAGPFWLSFTWNPADIDA